jgi:hypothetical protein
LKADKQKERARQKCRAFTLDELTIKRLKAVSKRHGLGSMSAAIRFLAAQAEAEHAKRR